MANNLLDFSYLNVKHADTGKYLAQAISGVGDVATDFFKEQGEKKAQLYSNIERTSASPREINNATIQDALLRYTGAKRLENIQKVKDAGFILDPRENAEIMNNLADMDEFISSMKQFSNDYDQYNASLQTNEGRIYYEPKEGAYESVINSLNPDEKGNLNISKVNEAVRGFYDTETKLPGLNYKKQDIDAFINNKNNEWIETHSDEPVGGVYDVVTTPAGSKYEYEVFTTPVDWTGYKPSLKTAILADPKNYGMLKTLSEDILTEDEKALAIRDYSERDDMGNIVGNEQTAYLNYYLEGIPEGKAEITERKNRRALTEPKVSKDARSSFWFGGKKEENAVGPKSFEADEYKIDNLYSISGRLSKEVVDVISNAKTISGGETEEAGDIATTGTGYRVVGYDADGDNLLIVTERTIEGMKIPEYILAPREDNEEMMKKLVDPATYREIESRHKDKTSITDSDDWELEFLRKK
jgi:hypothetical protein